MDFSTGLYGHIFIPASYWNDLGDYCNRHIPYILKQMSADDFVRDIEKVFLDHPLKVFPVAHYHFVEVCHFLESVLETWIPNWTLSTDINDLIKSSGIHMLAYLVLLTKIFIWLIICSKIFNFFPHRKEPQQLHL